MLLHKIKPLKGHLEFKNADITHTLLAAANSWVSVFKLLSDSHRFQSPNTRPDQTRSQKRCVQTGTN